MINEPTYSQSIVNTLIDYTNDGIFTWKRRDDGVRLKYHAWDDNTLYTLAVTRSFWKHPCIELEVVTYKNIPNSVVANEYKVPAEQSRLRILLDAVNTSCERCILEKLTRHEAPPNKETVNEH